MRRFLCEIDKKEREKKDGKERNMSKFTNRNVNLHKAENIPSTNTIHMFENTSTNARSSGIKESFNQLHIQRRNDRNSFVHLEHKRADFGYYP